LPAIYDSAFNNVTAPKQKKARYAIHAAMLGGSIPPYPKERQKL
jgi:hypothetical protein